MAWAYPLHSRADINTAGKLLLAGSSGDIFSYFDALEVINNWRASHAFPLNTFQMNLRRKGRVIDDDCLVAQRIKRLSSIEHKLSRFPTMKLSQMQDIGGCRAIMSNNSKVYELVDSFKSSDVKHKIATEDNYITRPKLSGYRGIHLVYRYFSDRKETYNGLKIEIQIRSQLQHAWATSVEVVGTMVRQALKSSQGEQQWLRFFQLMSTALAIEEGMPPSPDTPSNPKDLREEIRGLSQVLRPIEKLQNYSRAIQVVVNASQKAKYYLLELKPSQRTLSVMGYVESGANAASDAYLKSEKSLDHTAGDEAVLVSLDSIDALRKAYPNYFLDTTIFTESVKRWISN